MHQEDEDEYYQTDQLLPRMSLSHVKFFIFFAKKATHANYDAYVLAFEQAPFG